MPILTILVPTFNRQSFLNSLLSSICGQIAELHEPDVSILVSDNKSTDQTSACVDYFAQKFPFVRYFCQPEHLPTAEENIFSAVLECDGTYVWTLSDDDMIYDNAVKTVLLCLRSKSVDFILFNVSCANTLGVVKTEHFVPLDVAIPANRRARSLRDIVYRTGFIGLLTSASSAIFKRENIQTVDWRNILRESPIYAHSAIYFLANADKPALFIDQPIVRVFDDEGVALEKISYLSKKDKRQNLYSWTIGVSKLMKLTGLDMGQIFEVGPQHRVLLGDLTIHTICRQIDIWLETGEDHEAMTDIDMQDIIDNVSHTRTTRYMFLLLRLRSAGKFARALLKSPSTNGSVVQAFLDGLPDQGLSFREAAYSFIRSENNIVRSSVIPWVTEWPFDMSVAISPEEGGVRAVQDGEVNSHGQD